MITAIKQQQKISMTDRLLRRKIKLTVGRLCGFDCLYITSVGQTVDCEKIRSLAGRAKSSIIVPKSMQIAQDIGIDSEQIRKKILIASAVDTVIKAKASNVAILDVDGRYSHLVEGLIQNVGRLLIITSRIAEYNKFCEKMRKKYGYMPVITDSYEMIDMCSVMIAPDGLNGIDTLPIDIVIFSPDGLMSFTVDEKCIDFPFDTTCVEDYSPLDIYAALVVMSTKHQKKMPTSHSFIKNNKIYLQSDVVSMITALDMRVTSNYNINIANLFLNKRNGAV